MAWREGTGLAGPYYGVEIRPRPRMTPADYAEQQYKDTVAKYTGVTMKPINMDKDTLIKILKDNRVKHRQVFEDALEGYATHAKRILNEHLTALRNGKTPDIRIVLDRPEDHTKDYDRVIGMLEHHLGVTFEVDEQSYRQYVDDDWAWKRQWIDTSSQYAAGSVQAVYGE